MKIKRIPEIDGLRAFSVFIVLLYHIEFNLFGMNFFKGGYFGVDIFFVISGFVITNFIYSQYCRSIFSIKDFYIRRVKRLIPNLLCCITFTLCLGYFFLLPENYLNLSKQSIFSSLSLANFYFYFSGVEYNAENPKLLPLLHTWSLSVEEQFYLLFPLFFIFFLRKKYLFKFLLSAF